MKIDFSKPRWDTVTRLRNENEWDVGLPFHITFDEDNVPALEMCFIHQVGYGPCLHVDEDIGMWDSEPINTPDTDNYFADGRYCKEHGKLIVLVPYILDLKKLVSEGIKVPPIEDWEDEN